MSENAPHDDDPTPTDPIRAALYHQDRGAAATRLAERLALRYSTTKTSTTTEHDDRKGDAA